MRGHRAACKAIAAGDIEALRRALGADPEAARHWKPIVDAAFAGRSDMVDVLLAAGADPNVVSGTASRHTPLTRITQHHKTIPRHAGHARSLATLLAGGADPNRPAGPEGLVPLAYATVGPYSALADLLVGGTRIDIHLAAALHDRRTLTSALREPGGANEFDSRGRSPLHFVALSGFFRTLGSERSIDCAAQLLDAGADVDVAEEIDEGGEIFRATPLWRALSWQKHYALAEYLLEQGADPSPAVFAVTYSEGGRRAPGAANCSTATVPTGTRPSTAARRSWTSCISRNRAHANG